MILRRKKHTLLLLSYASYSAAFQPSSSFRPSIKSQGHDNFSRSNEISRIGAISMSISATTSFGTASGALKVVLKKPSKVLTVCLEYDENAGTKNTPSLTALEQETLSMQLRKLKAAAVWTSDVEKLAVFAREQELAMGNFPGPCPVVFSGSSDRIKDAVAAGASAVVLGVDSLSEEGGDDIETEVIWRVSSAEEVERVTTAIGDCVDNACFLIDCATVEGVVETLEVVPQAAVRIAVVDAMQPKDEEVNFARSLKRNGCASILVRGACVGDAEDVDYARFVVEELTSKKSSEFNFSGLTGSANGHFGGVASSGETSKWRRAKAIDS
uniref:Indole-3-glycerol-phosphate synthase n=1 Tax=Odontella aurita TaxID=265563 RepID=A0A7S4JZX1_9STRA|mmetsp:Transcript_57988/g.173068  ORF Transcript_57988/g.173068 Transcript_57988/m.173068 type:complete len:327 (+) Transcript_57988:225-1205(+)